MGFLGREQELQRLEAFYRSAGQSVALVYGRRRVGKSELIKQSQGKTASPFIYFECKQTTEQNNLGTLAALVSEVLGFPQLAFTSIEELLGFVFTQAKERSLVLVLDEYPYLRDAIPGIDSILQTIIDAHAATSRLKLILCGSFITVMKSLLEEENPLYGRVDLTINLHPMDYRDASLFYPSFSPEDRIRLFSVFGGIPYYNRLIDANRSVRQNIIDLIASPGARLETEIPMYLASQLKKIANANEVLESMARGAVHFNDILSQSHVSSSPALADTLSKLIGMELIVKQAPINDVDNKKKTRYLIDDNMALFYYRYIFRNSSQMAMMAPEAFFDRFIAKDFSEVHVPERFERICAQYLVRQNRAGTLAEPFDIIGRYWYDVPAEHRNGEFDIVTSGENGYVFYEVKFRSEPLSRAKVVEEIAQVKASGLDCRAFGFFSRSGFEDFDEPAIMKFTPKDLYA